MKKVLSLSVILFLINCSKNIYYGYLYDGITKMPLSNVKIIDMKNEHTSFSQKNGYFQIEKIKNSSTYLIFQKDLYYTDTIRSIRIQNGERQIKMFKGDTIFLLKNRDRDSIFIKNKF